MAERRQVSRAIGLNAVSMGLTQAAGFARAAILARLLAPEAFGLFGLALVGMRAVEVFSDFGLKNVLIAKRIEEADENAWLNTLWTLEFLRGVILFGLLALLSWPVAAWFDEPGVQTILVIVASTAFFRGLVNPGMYLFEKQVRFGRVVLHEQGTNVFTLGATVGLAWWLGDARALAFGLALGGAWRMASSYVAHGFRPRWMLDPTITRTSLSFGASLLVVSVLTYLTTQFDNLVIGKALGTEVLGLYMLAYKLATLPVNIVGTIANRALYPTYARLIHEDRSGALGFWAQSVRAIAWLLVSMCLPLALSAEYAIRLVYGDDWTPAASALVLLVVVGLLRGLSRAGSPMLMALERPGVDARAKVLETALFVALVLALVGPYGMEGAAMAGIVCYGVAFVIRIGFVAAQARVARRILVAGVPGLTLGAVASAAAWYGVRQTDAPELLAMIAGGTVALAGAVVFEPWLRGALTKRLLAQWRGGR